MHLNMQKRAAHCIGPCPQVYLCVNNAGLALGTEPVQSNNLADMRTMLETNVLAVMALTKQVAKQQLLHACCRSRRLLVGGALSGTHAVLCVILNA